MLSLLQVNVEQDHIPHFLLAAPLCLAWLRLFKHITLCHPPVSPVSQPWCCPHCHSGAVVPPSRPPCKACLTPGQFPIVKSPPAEL